MQKILKMIAIIMGTLILLAIVGIIFIVTFVSPNRLKPMFTEQVMKYTGRQLIIDGDLSWTFFPSLGVKIGHSTLSNPTGFKEKTFAEISEMTMNVKLMPLFSKKVESDGIILKGMTLHLIKSKNGEVNWNLKVANAISNPQTINPNNAQVISGPKAAVGLIIKGVSVTNAAITYRDEQTNKQFNIKNFELHAASINLLEPFPVNSSFDFISSNPVMNGKVSLTGKLFANMNENMYSFKQLQFASTIQQQNKKIDMNFSGDVIADFNKNTLVWQNFKGKVVNVNMTGQLEVSGLNTKPLAIAHIKLLPFDLRETLQTMGEDITHIQIAQPVAGQINLSASAEGVKMQGDLGIDRLQVAKLTLTNLTIKSHLQDGILDFAPISADLYQGKMTGQAIVNLKTPLPQMTLHAKISNVQTEPLFADLRGPDQKIKIGGIGNFEIQVTTLGKTPNTILQNLNGVSQFHFNNGNIIGVDLGYLVDSAYALLKHQPMNATNTNQTNFGTLSGTAVIRNGIINNNDLFGDTPRFTIRGVGNINLVAEQIDYSLQTQIKQRADQKDNLINLYGITLPVIIKGNLNSPNISLDSSMIAKEIAQQQIKKITDQTKDKIRDQIQNKLGGKAQDLLKGKAGDVLNNLLGK